MQSSEQPFKEYWTKTIWPALQTDYERLVKTTPTLRSASPREWRRRRRKEEGGQEDKKKKDKEPEA